MNRRATTLLEMLLLIGVVLPIAGSALVLAHQVSVQPLPPDGRLLAAACLRLRQDAQHGARQEGGVVVAGAHRWEVRDGAWRRDGVERLPRVAWTISAQDGRLLLQITTPGLPTRTLDLPEARP